MKSFIQASEIRGPSKDQTLIEFRGGLSKGPGMRVYSEPTVEGSSAIGLCARKAGLETLLALPVL